MNTPAQAFRVNNSAIGKIILGTLIWMLATPLEGEALQGIILRIRQQRALQTAGELAQKATEAAKKGDFTTSRRHLSEIDALAKDPYVGTVVQNSPVVQEAKRVCSQAEEKVVSAAAEKAELEKRAREKAIAGRVAFEQERIQKQAAQRQEDERKAAVRQQRPVQFHAQPVQQTPQTHAWQDGQSFASSLKSGVSHAATSTNPRDIPRFQTDKPTEASLDAGSIGGAALAASRANEVSQHLHVQAKGRQTFKIDPHTDPLFIQASQAVSDPQKALKEQITEISGTEGVSEEIKVCEEGGDEYVQSCSKRLEVTLKITPEVGHITPKWCIQHWKSKVKGTKYSCGGCRGGDYVITQHKKVEATDKWIDGCAVLEDLTEKGFCRYGSKTTSARDGKPETRTIQEEPVTRDHFEEQLTYTCFKAPPATQSCAGLRERGCFQIASRCKEQAHLAQARLGQARLGQAGNVCVLWEQTYSCPSGKKSLKSCQSSNRENPFCLTGNCADTSYEANNEMMNTMSHLYALREAQNDLRNFKVVFKGQHRWCSRNCLNFRDCCGSGKGWGVSLHLSSCDAAEIELKTLRDKNLCIQVGTYCAERDPVFKSCLRKKTTFCCYGTKMARLIQQNGRAQLGIRFGSPEAPDCEGLSPEQLSRIDFSKINFSEIFEDIKNQTVAKDQKQSLAQVSAERLQNNMTLLTQPSLNPKSAEDKQKLKEKGL